MNPEAATVCVIMLVFEIYNCADAAPIICDVLSCQCFVLVLLF